MIQTTVIIPNYNGEKYIENCIKSLRQKPEDDYPILVIDNGSADSSRQWLKEHEVQYNYSCIYQEKNTGFCAAVNLGIKKATTPYVILLNNDTECLPGFVQKLTDAIEQDDRIFSASAMMLDMKDSSKIDDAGDEYCALGWAYARGKGKLAANFEKPTDVFFSCGGAAIYNRAIAVELGMFDENHFAYLEDADIGYRSRIMGYRNVYAPMAKVIHAGSATSGSRYNEFKVKLSSRNNVYLILKNMPLIQLIINMPLLVIGFGIKQVFFIRKGYGKIYFNGLVEGVKLFNSQKGHGNKVKYNSTNLKNYFLIQIFLWKNTINRLFL